MRRRFYRQANFARLETGWTILLDRRPVRTPAGKALRVTTQALAEAVAGEWNDQEQEIRPDAMPLTRLAMNANDRIPAHKDRICQEVLRYAQSDLVCYRASEPEALAERQWRLWQPLVDWLALAFDAPLTVTRGVMPIPQPPESLAALGRAVEGLDDFRLTALAMATGAGGSLAVALALLHGRLDGDGAFELCQLDETYQIERWGEDAEAADKRAALRADLVAIARFLALL